MTEGGFWALCEAVKGVPLPNGSYAESAMRCLDLSHNPGTVGEAAVRQLADSINTNKKLRVLRLAHCRVSDAMANLIACGLEETERECVSPPCVCFPLFVLFVGVLLGVVCVRVCVCACAWVRRDRARVCV